MKLSPNFSATLLDSSLFKAAATLFIDFLPREKEREGREREKRREREREREGGGGEEEEQCYKRG